MHFPHCAASSPAKLFRLVAGLCLVGLSQHSAASQTIAAHSLPPGVAPLPVTPPADVPLSPVELSFTRIAAADLDYLKQTLEKAGWPRSHVLALLSAEGERRLNPAFVLSDRDLRPFEFWHTGPEALPMADLETPEYAAELARRARNYVETLAKLFPPLTEVSSPLAAWDDRARWGPLAADKKAAVRRIVADARAAVQTEANLPEGQDWTRLWRLQREARQQIEQLLTKEELLDYDLRNSTTAEAMRIELDNFQPTREEFLTIFKLRHPLELGFPEQPDEVDPLLPQRKQEALATVERQLEAALGRQRHEEYLISRDALCMDLQFYARHARNITSAQVRELYFAVQGVQARLAEGVEKPVSDTTQQGLRVGLYEKLRAIFGDQLARRYLEEHNLAPSKS